MSDVYDASDRADVKANATAARLAQRSDDEVVRTIMRSVQGRQWINNLLARCHLYESTFCDDALRTAFSEGERNIGLMLQATIVRTSPDELILMMREAHARDITTDLTRRNRRNGNADSDVDTRDFVDYAATIADANSGGDEAVDREE